MATNPELNKQLENMQLELDELREEFKEFVYIVSHDLGGPLRTIDGFTSIIAEKYADQFDEKTLKHVDLILTSAKKGQQILDVLMAFSRLNTTAEPFGEIDTHAIIKTVEAELSDQINASSAKIRYDKLPNIIGDEKQISLVFYHLMQNALTYRTKNVPADITISTEELEHLWQFTIKDNGLGVKPTLAEKIFKPLRRGVKDTDYPGMGMGLAISKKIVQRHNGSISVESESDLGSTFRFTISKVLDSK